jgi:hypothetical protein
MSPTTTNSRTPIGPSALIAPPEAVPEIDGLVKAIGFDVNLI